MASVISTRIKPAAAALSWKAASGRDVQLKIWIGSAVKGDNSPSGRNATYVNAPIVIRGAASRSG